MKAWMTAAALASIMAAGTAQAGDVSWTVTIGSPRHTLPEPRVIYTPVPVIYTPVPVIYQPVVLTQPAYRIPPGHMKKWHKHSYKYGHKHDHDDGPRGHRGDRHGRDDD